MRIEEMPKDCIRTNTGLFINVFEPTIDMISAEDIAHAQSHQCRWAGHIKRFYSVAQHSVMCMQLAENEDKIAALFHDGSEAYLLDIPTPIKSRMPEYKEIEHKLMLVIAQKFGFKYPLNKELKHIDRYMLQLEWDNLADGHNISFKCWTPEEAKENFLSAYYKLINKPAIKFA